MLNNPFQEDPAANRNQRQQLDHLLKITAPHERTMLAFIGLGLLAVVAWAAFGSVARSLTVDGLLIKSGMRHEVVSSEPGHLMKYLVAPGDMVAPGDAIAHQSVPELDREIEALADDVRRFSGTGRDEAADVALLQMKAKRNSREWIVSHIAGEVLSLQSAPGKYLLPGETLALLHQAESLPLQAVLRVDAHTAQRVRPGMQAWVEFVDETGQFDRRHGEVASVSPGILPNWLAVMGPAVSDSMQRVDITLHETSDLSVADGTKCRVRIELGRYPLNTIFGSRGG